MALFDTYVGIDYSGAKSAASRLPGLKVFQAGRKSEPCRVVSPAGKNRNWTRREVAEWCIKLLQGDKTAVIGIDHGFSFPLSYMQRYCIVTWDQFLDDFQRHWPADRDDVTVESLRKKNHRTGRITEFRITENWTSSAQCVFKLDGAGTVGKSTHAGIPWLRFIRRHQSAFSRTHFWPFDGFDIPAEKSVIVEIFPSIFRRRYPRRYKSADEHDASCVARWLAEMDIRGHLKNYFAPPLTAKERAIAQLEGWILGIY